MTARSNVSKIVTALKPTMAAHGFVRHGMKFVRTGAEVVSLVEFQVSRESDARVAYVAINYGVVVPALVPDLDATRLIATGCHWHRRLHESGDEQWWGVRVTDSVESSAARFRGWLETTVLPELATVQRESDLIASWVAGRSPGLSLAAMFVHLGKLLHRAGRLDEVRGLLRELESRSENRDCLWAFQQLRGLPL